MVLLVQALLFADGGITALGTNITLMALVAVVVGWLVFRGLRAVLPRRTASVAPAAAIAAFVERARRPRWPSPRLFAVGGTAPVALDTVLTAMLGWHLVIGLGEAAITGLVVGSVVAVRPDLVYGARGALAARQLEIRRRGRRA